ncbi:NAD-dependent deacylase [Faecalibacter sp. LW9]|uniref:SIR2 family NAD-dependent protein deacylase n=1 Tax=Faecalibacter sp. LW9 TaxID=3103144 RepID=UPI002AFE1FFF|nr:NAD-dependent deacylase [Faecalibacter sp. LW9]
MKNMVILTGAGISAESGISTFRDANGLWENYDIMEVASIEGWKTNPSLVLDFYNQRRAQLKEVMPNKAHYFLAELETNFNVTIITQNVDNLHERAGSTKIIHLHGELNKVRSVKNENLIYTWEDDLMMGDFGEDQAQLRPHIVWFGEMVPEMESAIDIASQADLFLIIGTSLQVYPAASLIDYVPKHAQIISVDPNPLPLDQHIYHIRKSATQSISDLKEIFKI